MVGGTQERKEVNRSGEELEVKKSLVCWVHLQEFI